MTELAELKEKLRDDASAWHDVDLGVRLAEAAAAIERLEREREGLRFSAEYAEAQRQAAESRALTAEAEVERLERESAQNAIANSRLAEQMERTLAELEKVREALKGLDAPWVQFISCWNDPSGDPAYDAEEEKGNVKVLADAMLAARRALSQEERE